MDAKPRPYHEELSFPEPLMAKAEIVELSVFGDICKLSVWGSATQQASEPRVGTLPVTGESVPSSWTR